MVAPSNAFSNLAPKHISFKTGGIITAILGIISFPWLLINNAGAYIVTWLVGYGSLLGAVAAVMIADYWIVRRRRLDLVDLYNREGRYAYSGGYNWKAIIAVLIGVIPVIPGFFNAATTPGGIVQNPTFLDTLYTHGLFFTFTVVAIAYLLLSLLLGRSRAGEEQEASV